MGLSSENLVSGFFIFEVFLFTNANVSSLWYYGRYQSSLGNKRVELFDMGAGGSDAVPDDNVRLASGNC